MIPEGWSGEPRLVVFFIPLPRSVAIPDQATFDFVRSERLRWAKEYLRPRVTGRPSNKTYVILRVHRVPEELVPNVKPLEHALQIASKVTHSRGGESAKGPSLDSYPSLATVVEAATPLLPVMQRDGTIDISRTIDASFDAAMECVGTLVRSYAMAARRSDVTVPTRHSLIFLLPFTTRSPLVSDEELSGGEEALRAAWSDLGFYSPTGHVDRYIPRDVADLPPEDFKSMLLLLDRHESGDPFQLFVQHSFACHRAIFIQPDYATAAIEAQLASEFFLDALLLVMAWEEGVKAADAAKWFKESLTRRIRKHYGPRLGGSWNPQDRRTVIGKWARHTRDLRNRVAHAGHHPTEQEVVYSQGAFSLLENYGKNRLLSKRNKYPRTTLMLLGAPGLKRRGLLSGRMKHFVDHIADSEPSWSASYLAWARDIEKIRSRR